MMDDERGRTCPEPDDAALIRRLARTLAVADPSPPHVEAMARELLTWRTVDAELAELLRTGLSRASASTD